MQAAPLPRRPFTAPCRHAPERWTEVDALVRDMLCSVATVAADTHSSHQVHAVPRRPLTACAGLQPVALVMSGHGSRSDAQDDSDSDGASFDDDGEEAGAAVNILRLGNDANTGSVGRGNGAPIVLEELLTDSERLLLGGRLWGGSSSPKDATHGQSTKKAPATIGTTSALNVFPIMPMEVAIIKAESLPKQCLFLGRQSNENRSMLGRQKITCNRAGMSIGRRGTLAPGAARVQSHNSWMTFRPVRDTHINQGCHGARSAAAAAGAAATTNSGGTAAASLLDQNAVATSGGVSSQPSEMMASQQTCDMATPVAPIMKTQPSPLALAAMEGPTPVPQVGDAATLEIPRKKGPKYRVVPGGSRPAKLASTASKQAAPTAGPSGGQSFLVVEFRTEPRVVPATRHSHKDRRGSGSHGRHQFRPGSRQWASERQALAAAAQ